MTTKSDLDIHQFFKMLRELDIFEWDDIIFEPYDLIGWTIAENYKDGITAKDIKWP